MSLRRILDRAGVLAPYHFLVATLGAAVFGFPSRSMRVIGVTGTKGKSSTTEFLASIFAAAGERVALSNSIHSSIAGVDVGPSGRSMPGRAALQRFLAEARKKRCTVAVIEMTSEGAKQHRHRGIALDGLIFLNLSPEHIESHGSLQKYKDAKFSLGEHLLRSPKRPRVMVANARDEESARYLALPVEKTVAFSLADTAHTARDEGGTMEWNGTRLSVQLPGTFSLENALAAAEMARAFGISNDAIARGIESVKEIPGRAQRIDAGQPFLVIVDYAHTPDSLKALIDAYAPRRRICVLGSAGGGRDTWKRPVMGEVAEQSCDVVILTNDDPYDEEPLSIIRDIERGMKKAHDVIPDRRAAIARAISLARAGDAVLITGKGIDPIYGPNGTKIPWNDAVVAREELTKLIR